MLFVDLNSKVLVLGPSSHKEGMAYELRTHRVFSNHVVVPDYYFDQFVERYRGDHRVQTFFCRDQFLCMAFAQLTYRDGPARYRNLLRTLGSKLYHAGIHGTISRSTLADANEHRDWRIYADLPQVLMPKPAACTPRTISA